MNNDLFRKVRFQKIISSNNIKTNKSNSGHLKNELIKRKSSSEIEIESKKNSHRSLKKKKSSFITL